MVYMAERRESDANAMLTASLATLEDLSAREELNLEWRRDLARSLLLGIELNNSSVPRGQSLDRIGAIVTASLEREPGNLATLSLSAELSVCRGELALEASERLAAFTTALDILDANFSESSDPPVLMVRYRALRGLERAKAAEQTRLRLTETGYRSTHTATCAPGEGLP